MTKSIRAGGAPRGADVSTHDRILLVAARLFRYNGFAPTTLREIAMEAGITAGSVYNHFSSKNEILDHVLRIGVGDVAAAVRNRVAALPATATWRERICVAIREHLLNALHQGDFTSANIRLWAQLPPEVKERHRAVRQEYAEYWRELIHQAQAAGEVNPALNFKVVELFVIGALNWTVEWYDPRRGSFDAFCDELLAIIFDGIGSPSATATGQSIQEHRGEEK